MPRLKLHAIDTVSLADPFSEARPVCYNPRSNRSPIAKTRLRWSRVTLYYFDDCTCHTPAFWDEATGQLEARDLPYITGVQVRPNSYLGEHFVERVPLAKKPLRQSQFHKLSAYLPKLRA